MQSHGVARWSVGGASSGASVWSIQLSTPISSLSTWLGRQRVYILRFSTSKVRTQARWAATEHRHACMPSSCTFYCKTRGKLLPHMGSSPPEVTVRGADDRRNATHRTPHSKTDLERPLHKALY